MKEREKGQRKICDRVEAEQVRRLGVRAGGGREGGRGPDTNDQGGGGGGPIQMIKDRKRDR